MAIGMVDLAAATALKAHHGQANHHDGEPYICHVHRVWISTRDDHCGEAAQAVAWLHDTLEDTALTAEDLHPLFPAEVVGAVLALTKRKGESNIDYYDRLVRNRIAARVKLHDLHDNFRRNHRIEDPETRQRLAHKYSLGLDKLQEAGIR